MKGSPGAFGEAYWDVNSLRIYNSDGKVASNGWVLGFRWGEKEERGRERRNLDRIGSN